MFVSAQDEFTKQTNVCIKAVPQGAALVFVGISFVLSVYFLYSIGVVHLP
jgi:hypothetical protein